MGQQEASGKKSNWKFNTKECLAFKSRREEEKTFLKAKILKVFKKTIHGCREKSSEKKRRKEKSVSKKSNNKKSDREDQQYSTPTRISKNTIEYFSCSFLDFFFVFLLLRFGTDGLN